MTGSGRSAHAMSNAGPLLHASSRGGGCSPIGSTETRGWSKSHQRSGWWPCPVLPRDSPSLRGDLPVCLNPGLCPHSKAWRLGAAALEGGRRDQSAFSRGARRASRPRRGQGPPISSSVLPRAAARSACDRANPEAAPLGSRPIVRERAAPRIVQSRGYTVALSTGRIAGARPRNVLLHGRRTRSSMRAVQSKGHCSLLRRMGAGPCRLSAQAVHRTWPLRRTPAARRAPSTGGLPSAACDSLAWCAACARWRSMRSRAGVTSAARVHGGPLELRRKS